MIHKITNSLSIFLTFLVVGITHVTYGLSNADLLSNFERIGYGYCTIDGSLVNIAMGIADSRSDCMQHCLQTRCSGVEWSNLSLPSLPDGNCNLGVRNNITEMEILMPQGFKTWSGGKSGIPESSDGRMSFECFRRIFISSAPSQSSAPSSAPSKSNAPTFTLPGVGEWHIKSNGAATGEPFSSDSIFVSIPFDASNRKHGAEVYTEDCVTPFNSPNYFEVDTTSPSSNKADGLIQFNTTLKMNITSINGTNYWNNFVGNKRGGWVQFCVQTFLNNTDATILTLLGGGITGKKVNIQDHLLNISVSLESDFTDGSDFLLQVEDSIRYASETDYSDELTVYECEESDPYKEITGRKYSQGDSFMICAAAKESSLVQMENFYNLFVSQAGKPYNYMRNGLYNPDITNVVCLEGTSFRVCYVKLVLLARFFTEENPTNLSMSGTLFVSRNDKEGRRNLHKSLSSPDEKEIEKDSLVAIPNRRAKSTGRGQFSLIVHLESNDKDESNAPLISGFGTTGMVSMTIGAVGATLLAY